MKNNGEMSTILLYDKDSLDEKRTETKKSYPYFKKDGGLSDTFLAELQKMIDDEHFVFDVDDAGNKIIRFIMEDDLVDFFKIHDDRIFSRYIESTDLSEFPFVIRIDQNMKKYVNVIIYRYSNYGFIVDYDCEHSSISLKKGNDECLKIFFDNCGIFYKIEPRTNSESNYNGCKLPVFAANVLFENIKQHQKTGETRVEVNFDDFGKKFGLTKTHIKIMRAIVQKKIDINYWRVVWNPEQDKEYVDFSFDSTFFVVCRSCDSMIFKIDKTSKNLTVGDARSCFVFGKALTNEEDLSLLKRYMNYGFMPNLPFNYKDEETMEVNPNCLKNMVVQWHGYLNGDLFTQSKYFIKRKTRFSY